MNQVVTERLAPCIRGNNQESLSSFKGLNFTRNDFRSVLFGALGLLGSAACTVHFEDSGRFLGGGVAEKDAGEQKIDTHDATPLPEDAAADASDVYIHDNADAAAQDAEAADAEVETDAAIEDQDIGGADAMVDVAAPDTGGPIVDIGEGGEGEGPLPCPPDPCMVGQGICERVGDVVCDEDGQAIGCDAIPGQPRDRELCNSADDNCDGQTDESFPEESQECQVGIGACQEVGSVVCDRGELRCNAAPGEPEPEECDGLDNNCDGQTDIDPQTGEPLTQVCEDCGAQECQEDGDFGDCGPDTDADGVIDCKDNCPQVQNPDQQDANQNGIGDDCDAVMGNRSCVNLATNPSPDIQTVGGNARVYLNRCGNVLLQPRRDGGSPERFYTHVPANPGLDPAGAHANVSVNRVQGAALGGCVGTTDLDTVESMWARGNCFEVSMGP